jgi:ankyrin repeat protein
VEAGADVGARAADDVTCAHFASQKGHAEVLSELIAANADIAAVER